MALNPVRPDELAHKKTRLGASLAINNPLLYDAESKPISQTTNTFSRIGSSPQLTWAPKLNSLGLVKLPLKYTFFVLIR